MAWGHILSFQIQITIGLHLWKSFLSSVAKSADPDEMLHFAAVHLDLHCLPKNRLRVSSIQRVNNSTRKHKPR